MQIKIVYTYETQSTRLTFGAPIFKTFIPFDMRATYRNVRLAVHEWSKERSTPTLVISYTLLR
jgi:hypothetical protein